MHLTRITAMLALAFSVAALDTVAAQSMGERLKRKAQERIDRKTNQGLDKAVDKAENTVTCAVTDQQCNDKAKAEGKTVVRPENAAASEAGTPADAKDLGGAGDGAFVNFDFVPGERVIFYDDFAKDNVGDFPRRWEHEQGNHEVAEVRGARYLRTTKRGEFNIPLPEVLPERFTVEFDFITSYKASGGWPVYLHFGGKPEAGWDDNGPPHVFFGYNEAGVAGNRRESKNATPGETDDKLVKARIMVDGKYVKVYVNGTRVGNMPNMDLGRAKMVGFFVPVNDNEAGKATLIGPIRIAAGGRKLYDALSEKGRVATQGIYFDTGSDRIRPESQPTLKEIGDMLKEHADLKLTIEGHTDNVGAAATNQSLSEKRAAAVKQQLVSAYGIDASRIEAKGLGASKPATSNDSAEGRQNNRRVELVKM